MPLAVGDTVRILDEPGQGTVRSIAGDTATIDLDGLDFEYSLDQLVKVEHDAMIKAGTETPKLSEKDRLLRSQGRAKLDQLQAQDQAAYELDLHIDALLDHYAGMSNGEILQYQMRCCRSFVREAIDKKYPKVILIHGVGEGVLRQEVHRYLDQMDKISYHDAPLRTYGYGATEVLIH